MSIPAPAPMVYLLDTDVLIEIERGNAVALAWFASLPVLPSMPGLVVLEILQGARNAIEMRKLKKMLTPLPIVWPTAADGAAAVTLFSTYRLSHNLGMIDALIAATAIGVGATIYTRNSKHYRMIPGLLMVKPF